MQFDHYKDVPLWDHPVGHRKTRKVKMSFGWCDHMILVDNADGTPLKDRFGNFVLGTCLSSGALHVVGLDGYDKYSGMVSSQGGVRINMYTGETFWQDLRVLPPRRGPRAGRRLEVATDDKIRRTKEGRR